MEIAYNYFFLSSVFNAGVILFIGLIVYYKNPKSSQNRLFALFCLAIFEWALTYTIWPIAKTAELALLSFQLLHVGACYVSILYLHFVIKWLKLDNKFNYWVTRIGYLTSTFFVLTIFTPYFIADMVPKFDMRFWAEPGILYHFYLINFFFFFLYASYLLFKSYLKSKGVQKKQMQFVLFGMVMTFIGGSTNYFLWYDINIPPYGNLFASGFVIFTAYAIFKYRLMDINLIIRKSAVFAVLVLIITAIYAAIAFIISELFTGLIGTQSVILNGIIMAILVAIGFKPIESWLSTKTDKYLFKAPYDSQEVISDFSDKMAGTLELNVLSSYITDKLSTVFKPQKVSLFILDEEEDQYLLMSYSGDKKNIGMKKIDKKLFKKIFRYLKKADLHKEVLVKGELDRLNEHYNQPVMQLFINELEKNNIDLVVPMYLGQKLQAILFLGPKKSDDIYSNEDIAVLEIISRQAAVAVQNAKLFEEQKNFARYLEKVVEERTAELKAANVQLKKLDKAKSEFISIASHQLRTPLTVIKGYISMINQGDFGKVPKKITSPMDKVFKSTIRIISLVEDLLNISRIESGRMKYELAKNDIVELVDEVCEELTQHAKNKGLKLECNLPKKKIPQFVFDRKKIREVIMNVVDNAIKYTEKGKVSVSLEKKDSKILFEVKDTGRGLADEDIDILFQKFSRATGAQQVHTEGTGLGLYIAKKIVDKHGGKIWAESEGRGEGATFKLTLKTKNPKLEKLAGKTSKA